MRERLALGGERLSAGLTSLAGWVDEGLILSTCNRTEVYAVAGDAATGHDALRRFLSEQCGVPHHTFDRATIRHSGDAAVRHLFRVACGLESMVLGEPQILAQLRTALEAARAAGAAGPTLTRLATDALRVGKRVRTETGIARNRLSIAHAGVELATRRLDGLSGRVAVVIGAGKMATLAAKLLRTAGVGELIIANRDRERADALAATTGGTGMSLPAVAAALERADLVVTAAATDHYVLDRSMMPERSRELVVVDLGVPRNVDPALDLVGHVARFDIDDLEVVAAEERKRYDAEIRASVEVVEAAVVDFGAWWAGRQAAPTIAALRARAQAIRAIELERALRKLGHLSARDRNVVATLSDAIINKLLHEPTTRLRQGAATTEEMALLRHLFGLETARPAPDFGGLEREVAALLRTLPDVEDEFAEHPVGASHDD